MLFSALTRRFARAGIAEGMLVAGMLLLHGTLPASAEPPGQPAGTPGDTRSLAERYRDSLSKGRKLEADILADFDKAYSLAQTDTQNFAQHVKQADPALHEKIGSDLSQITTKLSTRAAQLRKGELSVATLVDIMETLQGLWTGNRDLLGQNKALNDEMKGVILRVGHVGGLYDVLLKAKASNQRFIDEAKANGVQLPPEGGAPEPPKVVESMFKAAPVAPSPLASPTPAINALANRTKPISGKWSFLAKAKENIVAFTPADSEFEPLFSMNCAPRSGKVQVFTDMPRGTPAGRRSNVRIVRGAVEVAVAGMTEDGPSGIALTGVATPQAVAELSATPGDIVLAFPNGIVWRLPEKGLSAGYGRFLKTCGVAPPTLPPAAAGSVSCLAYKTRVTLTGTVAQRVYPGPPNFESVARGDRPETVTLLKLPTPACVATDPTDTEGQSPAVASIEEIQLVPKSGIVAGGTATLSGRLFGAHTGHHRTSVLLDDVQVTDGKSTSSNACDVEKSNQLDAKVKAASAAYTAAAEAKKNLDACSYNLPILFAMRELRAEINKCRGRSDLKERIEVANLITPRLEAALGNCLRAKGLQ